MQGRPLLLLFFFVAFSGTLGAQLWQHQKTYLTLQIHLTNLKQEHHQLLLKNLALEAQLNTPIPIPLQTLTQNRYCKDNERLLELKLPPRPIPNIPPPQQRLKLTAQ